MKRKRTSPSTIAGWREWISLPDLGVPAIKAKLDVGARTSALHAFDLEPFTEGGIDRIRFRVHPIQGDDDYTVDCVADLLGSRLVKSSTGHTQDRYVIKTQLTLGPDSWPIKVTLTNRRRMRFRMLLGRTAMRGHVLVDSGRSFLLGKKPKNLRGAG